ncbi:type 4 pilus major pilin [Pectobacterium brasiliense]|uniref:Putative type IV prepilin n=1 Tax=Pectobacterium brasiliense TaxID=180957 RepID=M4GYM2_9GAMM|nr:type 4 pilus major pilin [Pectobacterium brasiliense]AFH56745.1 putative type IV prepilin [Pectobacterium brasiliense]KMK84133.1 putative type IV prepilin [Pectobacterium brasiliense ICMP 19477]
MSAITFEKRSPHRGWAIMENGAVALIVIVVISLVLGGIYMLWGRKDVAVEVSNYQNLITTAQGLLKDSSGYNFSSGTKMTGTLIQVGGVKGVTVQGTRSSGTATLWNSWGGQIVLAPVASNGFNNGFTLTSEKIPQEACIAIATRMASSGTASGITINSAAHADGLVSLESAGSECLADSGRTGQNKLTFTING